MYSFTDLAIECAMISKDLYRIMPPDNKMRRRIVDASKVLGQAAKAIRQLDSERCTNPLRSENTCDMLVRDNDALRAKLKEAGIS